MLRPLWHPINVARVKERHKNREKKNISSYCGWRSEKHISGEKLNDISRVFGNVFFSRSLNVVEVNEIHRTTGIEGFCAGSPEWKKTSAARKLFPKDFQAIEQRENDEKCPRWIESNESKGTVAKKYGRNGMIEIYVIDVVCMAVEKFSERITWMWWKNPINMRICCFPIQLSMWNMWICIAGCHHTIDVKGIGRDSACNMALKMCIQLQTIRS